VNEFFGWASEEGMQKNEAEEPMVMFVLNRPQKKDTTMPHVADL